MCLFPLAAQEDLLHAGVALLLRGEPSQAAERFAQLLRQGSDGAEVWLWRGRALMSAGDLRAAEVAFARADRLHPGEGALWLARLYVTEGDRDKAFQALRKHLASPWRRPRREILLDTLLEPLERDPRWRSLWQKEWYDRRQQAFDEILGALAIGRGEEALQVCKSIRAQYPEDPVLVALEARAYLRQGDVKMARKELKTFPLAAHEDTTFLLSRAWVAAAAGDHAHAAATYERLFHLQPDGFHYLLRAATEWEEAGDQKNALKDLELYLRYFPADAEALTRAGELHAAEGNLREAMRLLSLAVKEDPGNPIRFVARADVYMKSRTYRYAIQDYGMALDLDPVNGQVYYRRGEAYLKTGQLKNACFDFERALHYGVREAQKYLMEYCGDR